MSICSLTDCWLVSPLNRKTACVRAVVNELQREKSTGDVPDFNFIALNGMEMRHPFEAYVKLWEAISNDREKCGPESAARNLEQHFMIQSNSPKATVDCVTVVLLDEIDYLVTQKQTVLYNFFDWPSRALEVCSKNRLVVIGVSNTMNLRDRLLPRVQSRIGSNEIFFQAYGIQQIVAILTSKLKQASPHYQVFDEDAVAFASKKTAAQSGDIRKAFHYCRRAAETILEKSENEEPATSPPMVLVRDILNSSREFFNSAESKRIGMCTPLEALLLVSIAALRTSTGREVGGFDAEEILTKMESIANSFGDKRYLPPPSLQETLGMLTRLGEARIVTMETPRHSSVSYRASLVGSDGAWPIVSMSSDKTAILMALSKTNHGTLAKRFLAQNTSF